jgi:hypothetical protein
VRAKRWTGTGRPSLTAWVLSFLVGIATLALAGSAVSAGGTTLTVTAGSAIAAVPGSYSVSISGTVDGLPESVYISGLALVSSRLVKDPDFGSRNVVVAIDLNVTAVGLKTGTKYVCDAQDSLIRQLVLSDTVQITFPFYQKSMPHRARSGVATFNLKFDVNTGVLTGATAGLITTPNF